MFPKVNPKQSFPKLEEEIIKFWNENDTFKKSIETRRESEEFNFYDGPPFATGTPHYGHILAGTIKDVIPRYQTMLGKRVDRVFGWDCHGLPIENIVEKKLGISGKDDIENKIGVFEFNEECRANVFGYVDEWRKTVERMGRWVDMDNDYKTMDATFMESVWWVFKSIYDKGLIYEGHRVVPYCPRCTTPLSNFEVNQGYKDKQSKTVTVKFKVKSDKKVCDYRESNGIIVRNEEGKILFGKRKTNGLLTLAGGKMDCSEDPMKSAIRELEEETGIKAEKLELYTCNYSKHNGDNWKEYVYILDVKNDIKVGNPESHKFEHWKFYDINELKYEEMESYDHQIMEQLKGLKETRKYHTDGNKYILAWTTTPWTLYANLGLAVGEDIDYVELLDKTNGDTYILAKEKVKDYYKKEEDYQILREYKGSCLVGIKYEPIFSDFDIQINEMNSDLGTGIRLGKNAWTVRIGHHVTTETGTGIVHIAPAYGEDDFIIGEKEDLGFIAHIDNSGKTYNLLENNGKFVFDFNEDVIAELKEKKLSLHIGTIVHSYPHCWRCDTPLIYRAISAWYVAVEKIRDKMVANNEKTNWVPDAIKHGRFGKWLEQARDWNISRNRYWGSALPIWQSEDKKEEVCVGSIEELYNLNKNYGQITKVIFVRHGRTDYNILDLMDYEGKAKLNELGQTQAENLKEKFKDIHIDAIYSSPLSRCVDTITPLSKEKGVDIIIEENLSEINSGSFQDKSLDRNWKKDFNFDDEKIGGGESILDAYRRVSITLEKIIKENKGKTIVICSHGEPLVLMKKHIAEYDYEKDKAKFIISNKGDKNYLETYVYSESLREVDLHKHFVDDIFVKNPKTGNKLKRIPEVLDCWFESGSMPYASKHYPFENNDTFKFPADFIAEGLDQTRGWFYTLIILSTALFDSPAAMNTIVNGIVLAEDGKKMSKSLKNYPDPAKIFDNYGADAMRYYLMNSPVVEAQDLRFSEAGVEEIVKKVILPLWNTYSFFTTYANIDKFEQSNSHIYFCRHGETDYNAKQLMNGGDVDSILTEKGEKQAKNAGKNLNLSQIKIDVIVSSPRIRAVKTAEIIASEIGYNGEIIIDKRLNEQKDGIFKKMSHEDIRQYAKKEFNIDAKTTPETRRIFKNKQYNQAEDIRELDSRVVESYKEIEEKYKGKNVLVVGHAGMYRAINRYLTDLDFDTAHFELPSIANATVFKLPKSRKNILDKWIISELNKLVLDVKTGFNNYKINEATRPITVFMDNLTNWYIRRSRKRFWGAGLDEDKLEAYETLYEVLVELCKVFAPVMPFVSEYIYKNLTGKESVHLECFPNVNRSFILDNLNSSFDKTSKLVNLGLAFRSRNKLRVRQPLASATIGEKLDNYYLEIIKEELNVKEIIVLEDSSKIAKKVCRPNAKLIGPKFGKDVQKVIVEAKNGNFEELEEGKIKVGEFTLVSGEYEIAYEKLDETMDIEAGFGMVIAMDATLTPELIAEGYARDLVRHIQESRKEAQFEVDDRILLELSIENYDLRNSVEKFKDNIQSETLSTIVDELENPSYEKEIELEEFKIKLALKKV